MQFLKQEPQVGAFNHGFFPCSSSRHTLDGFQPRIAEFPALSTAGKGGRVLPARFALCTSMSALCTLNLPSCSLALSLAAPLRLGGSDLEQPGLTSVPFPVSSGLPSGQNRRPGRRQALNLGPESRHRISTPRHQDTRNRTWNVRTNCTKAGDTGSKHRHSFQ